MVVLLGDSLTQRGGAVAGGAPGWAARLGELYARRPDVVNRGLSGYNTRWVGPEQGRRGEGPLLKGRRARRRARERAGPGPEVIP